ncbi:MAG: hypothetical protein JXK05_14590 [Campylobacterales bacterium]|nr:hypothetical protein [Campylobacterales bacterium]
MSAKALFIQHFRHARTKHLQWINQVKLMISGIEQPELPLNQAQSAFGAWLFDEALMLTSSAARRMIDELIALHTECYDHYIRIYHILHKEAGLLQGIFGIGKKASSYELQLAQRYYETLIERSDQMLSRTRQLESYLLALAESEYESMFIESTPAAQPPQPQRSATTGVSYYRGQRIE